MRLDALWRYVSGAIVVAANVLGYTAGLLIVVCTTVLVFEVVVRYWLHWPTDWEIEFTILALIIATFFGAAFTLPNRGHVAIEVLDEFMPARWNLWRALVAGVAGMLFCAYVSYKSWQFAHEAWAKNWTSDSMWAPRLWVPYGAMALGMTVLTLRYIVELVDVLIPALRTPPPVRASP